MTRVFFVDYENKCQNFVRKSKRQVDLFLNRCEIPSSSSSSSTSSASSGTSAAAAGALHDAHRAVMHVHLFYRSDAPRQAHSGNRKWITHHPIYSDVKNAADYALIEAVRRYCAEEAAKDDEIYVVCGGDKIYKRTFANDPSVHCLIMDGDKRDLADYIPLPLALRLFMFFMRWLFCLRLFLLV